jgi:hypothetical protein
VLEKAAKQELRPAGQLDLRIIVDHRWAKGYAGACDILALASPGARRKE